MHGAQPIPLQDRIASIDVLRGFALLGILLLNINGMGLPSAAYSSPAAYGGDTGADLAYWFVCHVFFDGKMRTIFSLLFGAGAILFLERIQHREGVRPVVLYYRRMFWMILFGVVHGNLLWSGDILYGYGICGLLLYPLWKWPARRLILIGATLLIVNFAGYFAGQKALLESLASLKTLNSVSQHRPLNDQEKATLAGAREMVEMFAPPPEKLADEIQRRRGKWSSIIVTSEHARVFETVLFFQAVFLDVLGMLVLGMGLGKTGFFAAQWTSRSYWITLVSGVIVGVPILVWSGLTWIHESFAIVGFFSLIGRTVDLGRLALAMAYMSGILLLLRHQRCKGLFLRLAAVGRMALTNYILTSLLTVLVFSGFGLGLFAKLSRAELLWVVFGVWAVILTISPWWLSLYRFGPLEWLWRTLTYGKKQPFQIK